VGNRNPRILLGVTVDMSLRLMDGFPEHLVRAGWEVHIVSSPGPELDLLAGVPGITPHALHMSRRPSPMKDLRSLAEWIRLLRTIRPDVMSVGTPKAGLLGGLAGRFTGIRHRIYVLRGLRLETSVGLQRAVLTIFEKLAIASAHEVVAVSRSLRDRVISMRLVDEKKVFVLGEGSSNGVEVSAFQRSNFTEAEYSELRGRLGIIEGIPVIGFVGRLTRDKGLLVLVEARKLLLCRGVEHQVLIVGGVDGSGPGLSSMRGNDLGHTVVTGYVPDPRIYYQLMDLLCLPTLREGFPNVVLEAASAGIPTVTTNATGAVDSVIDGETGVLVEKNDPQSLASGLERVLGDPEYRYRLGRKANARVRAEFDRQAVWRRYAQFYAARAHDPHTSKSSTRGFV